ncbi:class I adenylate-forming enzyme family protein [Gemmobacter sp.]|uniref:class I adenylate-forming enzyme family protein n=1 Tax=Gemmobacter sp. TaxID=1898957 RepID=UPI002AFEE35C|nr:class I adenylate-forming enzyme family protein [Gemmobacter sp.]
MTIPAIRTLGALIEARALDRPAAPALTYGGQTHSFAAIRAQTLAVARGLRALGVRPGDRAGLLLGNSTEWIVANFAIQYLGGTMVALNSWYTDSELSYVVEHADISVLLFNDRILRTDYVAMLDRLKPLDRAFPRLRHLVQLGGTPMDGALGWEAFLAAGDAVTEAEVLAELDQVQPGDIAYQLYTSGSTARPKGVLLMHGHLLENTWEIGRRMHFGPEDVVYMPLSLFWGMGCMNMLLGPWQHGAHIVLQHQFNADEGLDLIARHRCTVLAGTPNIIHAIFKHPRASDHDLSSMRKGTPIGTPDTSREIITTAMPEGVRCYGLTETHGFCNVNDGSDPLDKRCTTEGRAMDGWQVRIADPDTGRSLPPGELGEIRLKGRLMAGYYKNPQATAAAYDDDGWFCTGDLGFLDDQGYLSFKGRFKEMLKTGGINVAPAEVEEVLLTLPALEDAYVTGLPDPVQGEIVAAVLVLRPGCALTEDEVAEFCRARLAAYKRPRRMRFVSAAQVPLTATGKLHRQRLPELFA